jgi:hypothetical protein
VVIVGNVPRTPEDVARDPGSVTGPWLAEHLGAPGRTAAITRIQ